MEGDIHIAVCACQLGCRVLMVNFGSYPVIRIIFNGYEKDYNIVVVLHIDLCGRPNPVGENSFAEELIVQIALLQLIR